VLLVDVVASSVHPLRAGKGQATRKAQAAGARQACTEVVCVCGGVSVRKGMVKAMKAMRPVSGACVRAPYPPPLVDASPAPPQLFRRHWKLVTVDDTRTRYVLICAMVL